MTNPHYSLHTSDKTSPRGFGWIWFFRPAQALVSLIVLGLSATSIAGLAATEGVSCDIPGKMAWNLACVRLSPRFSSNWKQTHVYYRQSSLSLFSLT